MTQKELLHRKQRKAKRRAKILKGRSAKAIEIKELEYIAKIEFGERQLKRFLEPIIEQSKQREIEELIIE